MITIKLGETSNGRIITIIEGINHEKYNLMLVKHVLHKLSKCEKCKLTNDNKIILSGSHNKLCNEFVSRIGF